ncbi:hypothetical protein [Flavisolibacter tropicus]|uniref:Uncharacterized protein n=1 Tax=Flavisolibacter tropicus TaxID=1492898 RepID=A0A172TZ80_9BACT|nr:hypothetical protein [Flavisolibacter tropicus]ANE52306.1 hypothetical protein SY85_19260 [Flavisolibacter tropicus]
MSAPNNICKWLEFAFTEHVGRITEQYFFDKRDGEFYSVFITDYFLTDPNSSSNNSDSPYTKEELKQLSNRIDRQEANDPSILHLPRLTLGERKEMLQMFIDSQNLQSMGELQQCVDIENGKTNLDFNGKLPSSLETEWKSFKSEFIQRRIDSFCNLNKIHLETATLWTDKKMTQVSLDVSNTSSSKTNSIKPWWKFW